MGKSSSKLYDEIAVSINENDLSQFRQLISSLKTIEEPLIISPSCCRLIGILEDWNPSTLHLVCYLNKPQILFQLLEDSRSLNINTQDIFQPIQYIIIKIYSAIQA
jgi:hypothetical protein